MADEDTVDPTKTTIGDVFRVVNDVRKAQETQRTEQEEFRTSVEEKLGEIRLRLDGQTSPR